MHSPSIELVVAADRENGIGIDGKLPWRLPSEMAFFKRLTSEASLGKQNAVLMGRKTFESIPPKFRPLSGRLNCVLSRDPSYAPTGASCARSLEAALELLDLRDDLERLFVIGGGELYRSALPHPRCSTVHLTRVHAQFGCDTFFPTLPPSFRLVRQDGPHLDGALSYTFESYAQAR